MYRNVESFNSIIKIERDEYPYIKQEPVENVEESYSITEISCVPFLQDLIGYNGEQEFIIGDEEVDLTSMNAIEDVPIMSVIDSDDDESESEYKENIISLFNCAYCDFASSDQETLSKHIGDNHLMENNLNNRLNSIEHFGNNLTNDLLCNRKTYECYLCRYESTFTKLKDHFTKHTGSRDHECRICGKRLGRKNDLYRHVIRHQKMKEFQCEYCPKQFMERSHKLNHERCHTGEKPYACTKCPMRFSYTSSLLRHKRTHLGVKPFQCNICLKRFTAKDNLKAHASVHSDDRPFKCHCGKTFKRKRLLNDHSRIHLPNLSNQMLYTCDECPSTFLNSAGLNRHKQNHAGVKRYRCFICSIDFSIRQIYMEHMDTHKNLIIYKCQQCDQQFRTKKEISVHRKMHKNQSNYVNTKSSSFDCNVCTKIFNTRSALKRHVQIHSTDKRFQCKICSKRFQLQSYLTEHMKLHTGEKTFTCVYCSKRFLRRSRLELHKRSHLNEAYLNIQSDIISLVND